LYKIKLTDTPSDTLEREFDDVSLPPSLDAVEIVEQLQYLPGLIKAKEKLVMIWILEAEYVPVCPHSKAHFDTAELKPVSANIGSLDGNIANDQEYNPAKYAPGD
jgi:hypothetical protein